MKNKKSKQAFAVLFTLIFTVCVFSATAFATGSSATVPVAQQGETQTSAPVSVGPSPDSSSSPEEVSSENPVSSEEVPSSSEQVSSKPEVSSSEKPSSHTSSRNTVSSRAASSRVTSNVDTQQSRINERASQAEAAVSDPGALSSQDWSELLSSSSQPSSGAAGVVSDASSSASSTASQGGGVSALLIGGIILIVLGAAGIGYFIYAQFFAGRRQRMDNLYDDELPVDISSYSTGNTEPIVQEFEDISSNSTPLEQVRPAGTVPVKKPGGGARKSPAGAKSPDGQQPKPSAKPAVKPEPSDRDATMPIPKPPVQKAEPAAPPANEAPKAQATPVQKSDFDWEKFFNDNDQ